VSAVTNRPGWYEDPSGRPATYRWWDGATWTRWLTLDPETPGPDDGRLAASTDPGGATASAEESAEEESAEERDTIALTRGIALIVGTVALAFILVGVLVAIDGDSLPSGPAVAPPAADLQVRALLDEAAGEYVAGTARVTVTGPPFECFGPTSIPGSRGTGFLCYLSMHEQYRKGLAWHARTGFALLPDSQVVPGDLEATAGTVLDDLIREGFAGVDVKSRFKTVKAESIVDPRDEVVKLTGTLSYRVPRLPSRVSSVTIFVIKLHGSGKHVLFCADSPDDVPPAGRAAIDAAIMSLTVR
jgi:hypothetical protein